MLQVQLIFLLFLYCIVVIDFVDLYACDCEVAYVSVLYLYPLLCY